MKPLPVRSGADIHLADAFALPGCPLCRERWRTEASYLESILAESVNDVGFRQALDAGRGLCGRHSRAFLEADRARSGSLGASILLRATLAVRLTEIEAAVEARGWARPRRVGEARRPPACPACERVATADARSVETVVTLSADGAWSEAAASAPFCLGHLLALLGVRPVPAAWRPVEAHQVERLRQLRDRLDRYAHASAHDRRHLQTDDQRAAVDEAADLFAGPVPAGPSPARRASSRLAGASAVLLTGVYGSGKTTLAVALVDRLVAAGIHAAAIDLDWLGWYDAPAGWDEHEDPRITLEHLALVAARYRDLGVERLVLAGSIPTGSRARFAAAVGVPLVVIELRVTPDVVRRRLAGDPLASRADDLEVALERLDARAEAAAIGEADWAVDADTGLGDLATTVLERLAWIAGDPRRADGRIQL